ncbi:acyl-CoA thioesterase [bacterium]|nr:acyl-CoA thioesterase [bacterium]
MTARDNYPGPVFKTETRVLYADTDHGGVAYYGSYLRWFEIGRAELFRSIGITYATLESSGILCPVVELQCRYHHPARYDEALVIITWIERLRRSSITFGYRIVREQDNRLIATGQTTNAFVNQNLKCIRPPQEVFDVLSNLVELSI